MNYMSTFSYFPLLLHTFCPVFCKALAGCLIAFIMFLFTLIEFEPMMVVRKENILPKGWGVGLYIIMNDKQIILCNLWLKKAKTYITDIISLMILQVTLYTSMLENVLLYYVMTECLHLSNTVLTS